MHLVLSAVFIRRYYVVCLCFSRVDFFFLIKCVYAEQQLNTNKTKLILNSTLSLQAYLNHQPRFKC